MAGAKRAGEQRSGTRHKAGLGIAAGLVARVLVVLGLGVLGARISVVSSLGPEGFPFHTATAADYNLDPVNHHLDDQLTYDLFDQCDHTGGQPCSTTQRAPENANGSTTLQKRPSSTATTIIGPSGPLTGSPPVVEVGTTVHDSGTVTGAAGQPNPTGTVTVNYFLNGGCTGAPADTKSETLDASGNFNATDMPETPGD